MRQLLVVCLLSAFCFSVKAQVTHNSVQFIIDSPDFASRSGATITDVDLDVFLSDIPEHHRAEFLSDPERVGNTVAELLRPRSLTMLAQSNGILESNLVRGKALQAAHTVIANEYLRRVWEREALADYAQQAYELYLREPERLTLGAHVDFTHILIRTTGTRGELAALRSIISIYDALLEEPGLTLSQLAEKYSEDPKAQENSGVYLSQPLRTLDPEIAQLLAALPEGEISEPVKSAHGWHIVQLDRRYVPEVTSFEQVKEQALALAEQQHRSRVYERLMKQTSTESIQYFPGVIKRLLDRYPATEEHREKLTREVLTRLNIE